MPRIVRLLAVSAALSCILSAGEGRPCTSIMVGRKASADGSVMTSHTCDSHRTGSDIIVVPRMKHARGAEVQLSKRFDDDAGPMPRYGRTPTGRIPQVPETFGYLAPAYAAMNQRQLAIGESTFGGRPELLSTKGQIDCETLTRLMLERASTAREAIRVAGQLLKEHGWCDEGEALTVADTKEVWLLEIVGPGKDEVGAVWAAQRVPDDHVSVVANAARIGEIDPSKPDWFMASDNVRQLAEKRGYWDPKSGRPFRFYEAYNPDGRTEMACTRREWRALSLLAPSLGLQPNANVFPFSVKPERPVTAARIMELFRDTFEGTEFDTVKDLTVVDETGKTVKSPLANPFMPYDMNKMLRINGGWGWRGERPMARWYCMYATVTQWRGPARRRGRNSLVRLRQPGDDGLRAALRGHRVPCPKATSRRPHHRIQPPFGVVGVQSRVEDLGPSLGRHAPRRVGRPRPDAGEVPRRPARGGRHGRQTLRRKPGQGPRLPHAPVPPGVPGSRRCLLEPRRFAVEQVRRAVVTANVAGVKRMGDQGAAVGDSSDATAGGLLLPRSRMASAMRAQASRSLSAACVSASRMASRSQRTLPSGMLSRPAAWMRPRNFSTIALAVVSADMGVHVVGQPLPTCLCSWIQMATLVQAGWQGLPTTLHYTAPNRSARAYFSATPINWLNRSKPISRDSSPSVVPSRRSFS